MDRQTDRQTNQKHNATLLGEAHTQTINFDIICYWKTEEQWIMLLQTPYILLPFIFVILQLSSPIQNHCHHNHYRFVNKLHIKCHATFTTITCKTVTKST